MVAGGSRGCEQDGPFGSASLGLFWALGILFPIMSLLHQFARHDRQLCLVIYLIMVIFFDRLPCDFLIYQIEFNNSLLLSPFISPLGFTYDCCFSYPF